MATLPRTATKFAFHQRPPSDFDSGVNSSAAWTRSNKLSGPLGRYSRQHVSESNAQSLSDDEPDDGDEAPARKARALYDFQGKVEFRELDVQAGDAIEVIREDVGEGWSLVRNGGGEIGLLPQSYYTFTAELALAPGVEIDTSANAKQYPKQREPSGESITPRGSPRASQESLPLLLPQNTGEWLEALPSFRQSLLRGKSLNRFSAFVTSGAEEFVLKGPSTPPEEEVSSHVKEDSTSSINEEDQKRLSRLESERHFVDAGPSWQEKIAPFRLLVHSPSKRSSILSGAYTIYNVTSLFHASPNDEEAVTRVTVLRRFSHFVVLHTALKRRLPGIALPPLPEKQYAGRFSTDFVEARRGDLERYINKVVRHPIARYAEILTFFLSCESDADWKQLLPEHLAMPPAGPVFYSQVYHPAFNIDTEDAQDTVELFEAHTKAVDRGVQGLRGIFSQVREARMEMSKSERSLAYSLLSLITSKPISSNSPENSQDASEPPPTTPKGLLNPDGAWCWRDKCPSCLQLTKAIQKTSDTLQSVAALYDDHARRTQLATHESLKNMAHPSAIYEDVITTHHSTLSRYNDAVYGSYPDEDVAARCETVLNITMAEMDTYHTQKAEDFRGLAIDHLDGEIEFYQQVLARLKGARENFDCQGESDTSPRQSSMYERDLEQASKLVVKSLPQPCPHVFDSTPMRPVSVAIQEGVNMFLGQGGRGSVFGKLWSPS